MDTTASPAEVQEQPEEVAFGESLVTADTDAAEAVFRRELVALIPRMRAFARGLCGDANYADDLAQDALARAWQSRSKFEPGTNLKAWAFMILRNQFYSDKRRSWRTTELDPDVAEQSLTATDDPASILHLDDLRRALPELAVEQREALILVGAGGFSYEEAAEITGSAIGTVKSRVSRARATLAALMEGGRFARDDVRAGDATASIFAEVERARSGGDARRARAARSPRDA
jgi:RNA polymerase sigma-70 factor (ECF subfamily)